MDEMTGNIATSKLKGVSQTLLITLAARALAPKHNPDLNFSDPSAEAIAAALAFVPAQFADDRASMRGAIVRAKWFDSVARAFVHAEPDGLVVSIGSGLDTRAHRIGLTPDIDWIDIDLPQVIALRDALVAPLPHVRNVAADGTDVTAWSRLVSWRPGRAVLVLAEGVSMYLDPVSAQSWIRDLCGESRRKGSMLLFALDLASPFMVNQGHRNRSVRKIGGHFSWGVRDPADLIQLDEGLVLRQTYDVARRSGLTSRVVSRLHRLLTGRPLYSCALYAVRNLGGSREPPA
ncbi:class I SAM-dependent methyltransferase [Pseudomonas sp. RW10S2]|uniref:class I SAM-dependent methyltransferase n=1 Tax=Pseudomonas sp. RW10S2 TaxID=459637 RepID=UPI001648C542|nr:class I SAM-dependent methyltransferase [Pseudomonas sp. RW10S2]MBC3466861.1 class I SAM-dependent methyltransferase [Pseudomonas sp. RW10S2]